MTEPTFLEKVHAVRGIVESLAVTLPESDVVMMTQALDAGEPAVAYEHLCVQIDELEIPLTQESLDAIEFTGRSLRVDPSYWEVLKDYKKS